MVRSGGNFGINFHGECWVSRKKDKITKNGVICKTEVSKQHNKGDSGGPKLSFVHFTFKIVKKDKLSKKRGCQGWEGLSRPIFRPKYWKRTLRFQKSGCHSIFQRSPPPPRHGSILRGLDSDAQQAKKHYPSTSRLARNQSMKFYLHSRQRVRERPTAETTRRLIKHTSHLKMNSCYKTPIAMAVHLPWRRMRDLSKTNDKSTSLQSTLMVGH